jgi:hypothetical protein
MTNRPKYILPLWLVVGLLLSACADPKKAGITESVTETSEGAEIGTCLSRPVQPGEHPQCPGGGKVCLQEGAQACSMRSESRCSSARSESGICECVCSRPIDK